MSRLREPALAAALIAMSACGPERPVRTSARPALDESPSPSAEAFSTPATFQHHPAAPATLYARIVLSDGSALFAGERGERWLVEKGKPFARAAASAAPESLVGILPLDAGGYLFLGGSGTAYEAREALGPFVRSSSPLAPLVRARAVGKVLVGVKRDGTLVRSDTSLAAWTKVGPDGVRFEDVALAPDGTGLALAVPEALYRTQDFGASFQPLALPPRGARSLSLDASRAVVVNTILGSFRYTPGAEPEFALVPPVAVRRTESLGVPAPPGPSASALVEGRAALLGDTYVELRQEREGGPFSLLRGTFGGGLEPERFPTGKGCVDARLAGTKRFLYFVCGRQKPPTVTQVIEVYRSTDEGRTFAIEPYVPEGRFSELSLAVSVDGELVVSGVCPAAAGGPGCRPAGVHVRRALAADAGTGVALVPAATPALAGVAMGLAFSHDGRSAFALGRRSKSDSLAVFVSHDGGSTFEPRDVESLTVPDDDETRGRGRSKSTELESIAAAEDGTVALVVNRRGRRLWLVVDGDGHPIALSKAPTESARIGAAGQRGLAFEPRTAEHWESLDAGATWTALGKLPVDPASRIGPDAEVSFACVAKGCVFESTLTRVGWRGAKDRPVLVPPPEKQPRLATPKVGTPYSCTLEPSEWRRIDGAVDVPVAANAAIGKAVWYTLRFDLATSMVEVVSVRQGADGALERTQLLGPARSPQGSAFAALLQVEGAVALRYPLPQAQPKSDGTLRNVEVAWSDLLAGRTGRAVIPSAGPYRPGDYGRGPGASALAAPALLSIASGGVYLRLHPAQKDDQPTYFVDGRVVETIPPVTWPEEAARIGHSEMVHIGPAHVPLRLFDGGIVRATPSGAGYTFDAVSLGAARPADFGWKQDTSIGYVGDRAGRIVTLGDSRGKAAVSALYVFRGAGAVVEEPVKLPTQLDLPAVPRPCPANERKSTPRVVAPSLPGSRRPVLVADAVEPLRVLLTDDAVLHGTPQSPCVAAYGASLVSTESSATPRIETAIIPADAPERAWIFRAPRGKSDKDTLPSVEYRQMSCKPDPSAEVPVEVYRERDTLIDPT